MAVWKGLYSNVDLSEPGVEKPRTHEPRSQPGMRLSEEHGQKQIKCDEGKKETCEEESVYEPIDPAAGFEGKQTQPVAITWLSAWKPSCDKVTLAGSFLLAMSVFLNILLLALGAVHYSKMAAALDQMNARNKQLQETVPSTFLLYNENHKLCVTRKEPNHLTGAHCDPRVQKQHFQWFSEKHLRHVDSQLCLTAPKAVSKMAVLLKPCDTHSPLQRWECRDHDLLALEGEDLYFNYGNNVKKLVMLFDGNGVWSRWVIYGTHYNICSTTCSPFVREWTLFQDSYYYFSHSPGTWDVANQSCTSMKSHLVMINSVEEKDHIATIMKATSSWIGLTDQAVDGQWKWVDGTHEEVGSRYWHQNEPNGGKAENCVLMKNRLWYDYPCKETYHWICERKF